MKSKLHRKASPSTRPTISGLGLIAFDYVSDSMGKRVHSQAGGTCGNVLAILAALGWHASPIARLKMDGPGLFVRSDLERFGVDTRWINLAPAVGTPVIIEKLLRDSTGFPFHCFSFYCPGCGRRLSRFQPVPIWALRDITKEVVSAKVVFIDRVSPSAFALAKDARDAGALVFFEPSTSTSDRELRRILPFTHIFKYSHERMHETLDVLPESVLLEIQTLGRGGLRFRMRSGQTRRLKRWAHIDSYPVENMVDSSGAGDWFSAALIHLLFRRGERAARAMDEAAVTQALSKAQKLAAWSCNFIGARGAMYYAPLINIEKVLASAEIQLSRSGDPLADLCDSNLLCETCASDKEDTHSFPVRRSIFPRPQ